MNNKYLEQRKKFERFNRWEEKQIKKLPVERKVWQFAQLFLLKNYLPEETVKRSQQEHLNNLIRIQKLIKKQMKKL